jgi:hypothetical protein
LQPSETPRLTLFYDHDANAHRVARVDLRQFVAIG